MTEQSQKDKKHYLIVGLGNPGPKYALTRHNMGYMTVQALAEALDWKWKQDDHFNARVGRGKIGEVEVHLILPTTYMNESGRAVRRYMDFYKLSPRDVIVVSDDVALPFGEMRVRSVGSAGGHNGLKSIQAHLQTQWYVRLRLGIGRDQREQPLADYVLDPFTGAEQERLADFLERALVVLRRLINEEVTVVMNAVNKKQKTKLEENDS